MWDTQVKGKKPQKKSYKVVANDSDSDSDSDNNNNKKKQKGKDKSEKTEYLELCISNAN